MYWNICVLIESKWNINILIVGVMKALGNVLIESKWNVNTTKGIADSEQAKF